MLGQLRLEIIHLMRDDADNVWTTIRHMHMREAIDKLMADFNQFMQDNAGFKGYARISV